MGRKVIMVIQLIEESADESNGQIEKEITEELSEDLPKISWSKKVEKVTVVQG